jgi:hypothetical protein
LLLDKFRKNPKAEEWNALESVLPTTSWAQALSLSLSHTRTHGVVLLHLGWHENPELKSQIRHLET